MVNIRSFRHLGIWVAFIENDFQEVFHTSFGFTRDQAEKRSYKKLLKEDTSGVNE